jgi:orotate phosphoribosyltransferase-like protein
VNGCPQLTVNECKEHYQSKLDTVTIRVDFSKTGKLKFLIDTGVEISVVTCNSLRPGFSCESTKGINIKGIYNSLLRTEDSRRLKLFTPKHETTRVFQVMGNDFGCQYDGILGQDFWKNNKSTINYCDRTITMGEVIMSFDNEINEAKNKSYALTLKT